jgi:ADP-ribosylglycohydrolase
LETISTLSSLEQHAFACLAFGVIGDAMGSPTELLEPEEIEQRFGWVDSFEGDGTDDVIMRDLLAEAMLKTGGYATADDWAAEWKENHAIILGEKSNRFFPSILHAVDKVVRNYPPQLLAVGTMPSSTSAMAIAPVGIVNAGHPAAAAAQATEIASLVHVTENAFCQDGAAAIAAAIAVALAPKATVETVLQAALHSLRGWSAEEMRRLVVAALDLARASKDFRAFRSEYHKRFRQAVICDSRETVPAALAIVLLAEGDPSQATVLGANFGRDCDTIACMAGGICGALQGLTPSSMSRIEQMSPGARRLQLKMAVELSALGASKAATEMAAWANRI